MAQLVKAKPQQPPLEEGVKQPYRGTQGPYRKPYRGFPGAREALVSHPVIQGRFLPALGPQTPAAHERSPKP